MQITTELVKKVAANARLNLKEEELKKYAQEMQDILGYFEKLSEVNTDNVEPSFHPVPVKNVSRKDTPQKSLDRERAFEETPHHTETHFKGPKVI